MKLGRKLTLIVIFGVLLVTLPSITVIYKLARDHYLTTTLAQLEQSTQAHIRVQINILRRAENSLQTLAETLRKSLAQPANELEIKEFDALVKKDNDGVIRNHPKKFDGHTQAGVFIPKDVKVTNKVKRTKLRAMKLLSSFGLAALKHYDGIWFDQLNKTSVIFWRRDPEFIYKLAPDHDYTKTLWDQLASPKLNPKRITLWTPAIYESPVHTWVVSAVYPLDIEGRWEGILGHDIALTELLNSFKASAQYPSSQHFLVDGFGNYILAGFWQQQLEGKAGEFKPDLSQYPQLQRLLNNKPSATNQSPVFLQHNGRQYIAFSMGIEKLNWRYIRLIAVDEILQPVQRLFLLVSLLVLSVGLLIGLLINLTTRRIIVKPLLYLEKITRRYGDGKINQRAKLKGKNEIARMGTTFNTMADNIANNRRDLEKSEARYRFVLNSIHEAILILDKNGKLLFANPALSLILDYSVDNLLGQCFWNLIHPNESAIKQKKFQYVWTGVEAEAQEEFRIKTEHDDYTWVKLFLRTAKDDEGNKVFSATLIDISDRIFAYHIDRMLAQADNMALSSCLMEEILQMLCQQLSELFCYPLVWIALKNKNDSQLTCQASAGENKDQLSTWTDKENTDPVVKAFHHGTLQMTSNHGKFCADLSIPLKDQSDVLGVLSFQFHQDHLLHKQAIERLESLAKRVSLTLQRIINQHWLRLQRTAMESVANSICITNAKGQIEWANDAFSHLSGYQLQEIWGKTLSQLVNSHYHNNRFWDEFWETLKEKKVWRGEVINLDKRGQRYIVAQSVTPLLDTDNQVTHYIAIQEDITEKKAIEKHMEFVATHDILTGLANRSLLTDHINISLSQAKRHHEQIALLFLDLDRFKLINDTLGHEAGDELLQQVGERLNTNVRGGDLVARLGGDEFVIVLNYISSEKELCSIAEKIISLFIKPFSISGQQNYITTSMGICLYPLDGTDTQTLIKKADTAMYYAKDQGKNNFQFFTEVLNQRVIERVNLEKSIRKGIENNEFELYYQPQKPTGDENYFGLEALIRWEHPEQGFISPEKFIPVAEETGLIIPLGEWILKTACMQVQQWRNKGIKELKVSVNLSARQFNNKFLLTHIEKALAESQLPPHCLICELTESMMMEDIEAHINVLDSIKALGIKISIDDFGTGYSSLSYLKRFPIDELKIDKSFVDDIEAGENDRNIILSIITLGHNLGLEIVAEGIETKGQLQFLENNACDYIQGYYFSKPLATKNVFDFIQSKINQKILRNNKTSLK